MYEIKQSTAITVPFFVHDAAGDAVTGLSNASFTKRTSKNGAAFAAMTVTITEMENGWYSIPLSTAHSDTLGLLSITFTNAGAKQVNLQWRVEAKLVDDLNDIAATDIVSAGAITTLSGAVVNVDVVDTTTVNTDMVGTNNAFLAASAPTNFSAMVISVAGAVDSFLQGFINQLITESTAGNIASNFKTFYDNADALTTKVVDDVGGAAGGTDWTASERNEIRQRIGITGTTAAGGNTPDLALEATVAALNDFNPVTDPVAVVTLVGTTTLNTDMRGTDGAITSLPAVTDANMIQINGVASAAAAQSDVADTMVTGAAIAGTLTTTEMTTNLTEATTGHYNGRSIIFIGGVLADQATDVTAYDGPTKKLTFTGITSAPAIGQDFRFV